MPALSLPALLLACTSWVCAAEAVAAGASSAQRVRTDARNWRLSTAAPPTPEPAAAPAQTTTPPPPPPFALNLGIAHDSEDAGARTVFTPFSLSYQMPGDGNRTTFEIAGDGWMRATAPGTEPVRGLADLVLRVSRPLSPAWTAVLGVGVPIGGDLGSSSAMQQLQLVHALIRSSGWATLAVVDLRHYNDSPAGRSSVSQVVYGEVSRDLGHGYTVLVNLSYAHRSGDAPAGTTDLGVGYEFPLSGRLGAVVLMTRGMTCGARHTAAEFDLTYRF